MMMIARRTTLAFLLTLTVGLTAAPVCADDEWNDKGIAWQPYDAGLALAKKQKKPVCLIFVAPWSERCVSYARVFHDPVVVTKAKRFVMIRLELDPENAGLAVKYAPDGQYVPRTFFLSPTGDLWADVRGPLDEYKYFYDVHDPKSVLAGMDAALAKHR
jgi:hypothetical protein